MGINSRLKCFYHRSGHSFFLQKNIFLFFCYSIAKKEIFQGNRIEKDNEKKIHQCFFPMKQNNDNPIFQLYRMINRTDVLNIYILARVIHVY